MRIKKIMRNKKLMRIAIMLLIAIILAPLLPYKCILNFGGFGYKKLKTQNSSSDGLVLIEDCNELGLKSGAELDWYLLNANILDNELTIFKSGLSGYEFTLYGEFIENDDGTRKFYVEKWNSIYIPLMDTYIWKDKFEFIYYVSVLPALVILILLLIELKINLARS